MEQILRVPGGANVSLPPAAIFGRTEAIMPLLFFASGFAALSYQIAWQRALFGWFGVDLNSVSVIVSIFMLGLGGGALLGGWLADRFASHRILIFAAVEMSIALFGLVSLNIIDGCGALFSDQSLPVMIGATFLMLMAPTFAMGATLPILVTELATRNGNIGDSTGRLYYINTLGAATGALVSAYVLIPLFGLDGLTYVAASVNTTIAVAGGIHFGREMRIRGAQ